MKKVIALMLAVLMLSTLAFAAHGSNNEYAKNRPVANLTPGSTIKINRNGFVMPSDGLYNDTKSISGTYGKDSNKWTAMKVVAKAESDTTFDSTFDSLNEGLSKAIMRSITSGNYSISSVKIDKGYKDLVAGVTINDKEEQVEIKLKDDLNNTTAKFFEVEFKLNGKGKFTLRDIDEVVDYDTYGPKGKLDTNTTTRTDKDSFIGDKVTLPDISFKIIGTVGYGKVEVGLGDASDEELDDLYGMGVDRNKDVVKFTTDGIGYSKRIAGAYTADAILTEEYNDAMTLVARVYSGDVLFFKCSNDPDRDIVGRLADSDADMDFYLFNTNKDFVTFNSNATICFNDAEEDDFVYQIKDGKLVPVGEWSDEDDCWKVKARTLGQYVVSDVELKEFEAAPGEVAPDLNPDTGANDVVGIATALAAVALVSAAAISLKK